MIALQNDLSHFAFPEVHDEARCAIAFKRTLRIPDDGKDYPLPPGLDRFPLRHLDDVAERLPAQWRRRGGVTLPMHQAEAMAVRRQVLRHRRQLLPMDGDHRGATADRTAGGAAIYGSGPSPVRR